jgi:hypothetical protein
LDRGLVRDDPFCLTGDEMSVAAFLIGITLSVLVVCGFAIYLSWHSYDDRWWEDDWDE